jgi:hypothetical protein
MQMPPRALNVIKLACTRDGKIPILLEFDQVCMQKRRTRALQIFMDY